MIEENFPESKKAHLQNWAHLQNCKARNVKNANWGS